MRFGSKLLDAVGVEPVWFHAKSFGGLTLCFC